MYKPVTTGLGFTSDWVKKWCECFFKPIVEFGIAKPISFKQQMKTASSLT